MLQIKKLTMNAIILIKDEAFGRIFPRTNLGKQVKKSFDEG